jgi:hypothetical protein
MLLLLCCLALPCCWSAAATSPLSTGLWLSNTLWPRLRLGLLLLALGLLLGASPSRANRTLKLPLRLLLLNRDVPCGLLVLPAAAGPSVSPAASPKLLS